MLKQGVALLLAAASLLTATACTASGQTATHEPALDPSVMELDPGAVNPMAIDYPLRTYNVGNEFVHTVERGVALLEQACFRRFGLDLPLPAPPDARPYPVWDWYGLWDEQTARQYGYSPPPWGGGGEPFPAVVPADWQRLLVGPARLFNGVEVPEGGCQGSAHRDIGLDRQPDGQLVETLQRDAVTRARQHSGVAPLVSAWADCLKKQGWDFKDPAEPFQIVPARGDESEMARLAAADIQCKKETGLLRAWVAADIAYQRLLLEENSEKLRDWTQWCDEVVRKSNDVVASAGQ
ncbi:hypothetical protein [Plantactinospora sp. KBS50]|uniref:hypothetical protein n=1 Tax=Plantactinospora sp. KBS50 TaxID=2024580 RepID=UPI000BAAA9E0|nr:hypothetical protein [Plantactinospora sp. KBS50]ASW54551.1 hypothetical protein CIK06_10665 [Plantactinospora sp. KBS50]